MVKFSKSRKYALDKAKGGVRRWKLKDKYNCPGGKIRSKGRGRGLGYGKGQGPIGRQKTTKLKPIPKSKLPRFKVGDLVYSYQNPTVKREVGLVRLSDDPKYPHKYKLSLRSEGGHSYSSKWMNEGSLRRRKIN